MGLTVGEFWDLTPQEFHFYTVAYSEGRKEHYRDIAFLAICNRAAHFSKSKSLKVSDLVSFESSPGDKEYSEHEKEEIRGRIAAADEWFSMMEKKASNIAVSDKKGG